MARAVVSICSVSFLCWAVKVVFDAIYCQQLVLVGGIFDDASQVFEQSGAPGGIQQGGAEFHREHQMEVNLSERAGDHRQALDQTVAPTASLEHGATS